ncbi:hypothetical protein [Desertivirga arenae]|uniref:hypothetical protein n=1 Tax=Desertivirga arenae TaxID=2810309 RepID=UPI001A967862|nr:hypothetical protein [Pedobacter sp. SYSU D00823]
MQESTKFKFSSIAVEGLKTQAAEKESIVLNELLNHKPVIEDLLVSYYYRSRGRIYNVRINKPVLDANCNGAFKVNYNIGHFNACADVDSNEEESMHISINADLNSGSVLLTGEYFPEREPDEI